MRPYFFFNRTTSASFQRWQFMNSFFEMNPGTHLIPSQTKGWVPPLNVCSLTHHTSLHTLHPSIIKHSVSHEQPTKRLGKQWNNQFERTSDCQCIRHSSHAEDWVSLTRKLSCGNWGKRKKMTRCSGRVYTEQKFGQGQSFWLPDDVEGGPFWSYSSGLCSASGG